MSTLILCDIEFKIYFFTIYITLAIQVMVMKSSTGVQNIHMETNVSRISDLSFSYFISKKGNL